MHLSLTNTLILITAVTSFIALSNETVTNDLIFYPPAVTYRKQWYRFITCGFIHADIKHLAFNMISFYFFGAIAENYFEQIFHEKGKILYTALYFSSLVISLLPTYFKNRDNSHYLGLGASGAVSAVIFASIMIIPQMNIRMFMLPIPIPGFVYGPIYLIITAIMDKKAIDKINHSAHLWGALYGIVFYCAACFAFSDFNPFTNFVNQLKEAYFH